MHLVKFGVKTITRKIRGLRYFFCKQRFYYRIKICSVPEMAELDDPAGVESAFDPENLRLEIMPVEVTPSNTNLSQDQIEQELGSIKLNLVGLCCSVIFVTATAMSLSNFAPIFLKDDNLKAASLGIVTAVEIIAAIKLLPYCSTVFGSRKIISVALVLTCSYTLSYFYPSWGTTVPASILLAFGNAFAASTLMYCVSLGFRYCQITNGKLELVMSLMAGLITSCLGWGLLVGYSVLYLVLDPRILVVDTNVTYETHDFGVGLPSCKYGGTPSSISYESWRYYVTLEIYATIAIGGALLSLFLRDFSNIPGYHRSTTSHYLIIIKDTWSVLTNVRTYLLIVITVFIGIEEGFILSDHTMAAVSLSSGQPKVWLSMMISFGVSEIAGCVIQRVLLQPFGRTLTTALGIVLIMMAFIMLSLWNSVLGEMEIFIVPAGLWGMAHGILVSIIFSIFALQSEGKLECSISMATFLRCVGHLISYLGMKYLCVYGNLYLLIAVGLIGFLAYLSFEHKLKQDFLSQPSASFLHSTE